MTESRVLTCNGCGDDVEVFEVPRPFMDPARFRCIPCLDTRHAPAQLAIVGDDVPTRTETRSYDPSLAEIPF